MDEYLGKVHIIRGIMILNKYVVTLDKQNTTLAASGCQRLRLG